MRPKGVIVGRVETICGRCQYAKSIMRGDERVGHAQACRRAREGEIDVAQAGEYMANTLSYRIGKIAGGASTYPSSRQSAFPNNTTSVKGSETRQGGR